MDWLVFCACEGDLSKKDEIENRFTLNELTRWLCLKKFDTAE